MVTGRLWTTLLVLFGLVCAAPTSTLAQQPSLPQINFAALGQSAVIGSFAGLQLYDPSSASLLGAGAYDPARATVVTRDTSSGAFVRLGETNTGGRISAICVSSSTGTVYVGGEFDELAGAPVSNMAAIDPNTGAVDDLAGGLDGEVFAIACDVTNGGGDGDEVWVGGAFTAPVTASTNSSSYGGSVAVWSSGSWSPPPFVGLDANVEAIVTRNSSSGAGTSLLFGGAFETLFTNVDAEDLANASTNSNFAAANVPYSLGSSLTPVSLNTSLFSASPTLWTYDYGTPQVLLCPQADDGLAGSWFTQPGQQGTITAQLNRTVTAGGIRIANTYYNGKGTRTFRIRALPTLETITLSYQADVTDPLSPIETCTDACPLAHDDSVPYQDFLFPNGTAIIGFELDLLEWYGSGAGLHLVQLLSDGTVVYADSADNYQPCRSGLGASVPANASFDGDWTVDYVYTQYETACQTIYEAEWSQSTHPGDYPTITLTPYVTQQGIYDVYLSTPGCVAQYNCGLRTTISAVVQPGDGSNSVSTVVDQLVQDDSTSLVYSGFLPATMDDGTGGVEITLRPAINATSSSGSLLTLVAEKVTLHAQSPNGSSTRTARAFGLFEWQLDQAANDSVNALESMTNATDLEALSFAFQTGANVNALATGLDDAALFVGGNFVYSADNMTSTSIVGCSSSGDPIIAANGGLNGVVTSLAVIDGYVYAAGTFASTADGSVSSLNGLARWAYTTDGTSWEEVGSSVPTSASSVQDVTQATLEGEEVLVAIGGGGSGLAVFEPSRESWNATLAGYLIGNLTAVAAVPSNQTFIFAGNVQAAFGSATPSGAILGEDENGDAEISPLSFTLSQSSSSSSSSSSRSRSRGNSSAGARLARRQSASTLTTSLPTMISGDDDAAIVAGAYWTSSQSRVMLLGGQFSTDAGVQNVAVYNPSSQVLMSLPGASDAIEGQVRALAVVQDLAWIGGNFTLDSRNGLATYDLANSAIDNSQPPLSAYDASSEPTVNVIARRPGHDTTVYVAGAFASAGSLACQSVCVWDSEAKQWSTLGSGLPGVVGAVDFAGSSMIAAGEFMINGTTAQVAAWDFDASTWSVFGSLPGPATAVSSDNGDIDRVWAAGTQDSRAPYLMYWNGTVWRDVNADGALATGTGVEQLVFVPLSSSSGSSNDLIESNRMLLVSGALTLNSTSVSSALFDGESWHPYLISSSTSGAAGVVSRFFSSVTNVDLSSLQHMSVGLVILVCIAIGFGIVFLIVLIGLLVALKRRRDEPVHPPPFQEDRSLSERSSPSSEPHGLLATVGAATAVLLDRSKAHPPAAAMAAPAEPQEEMAARTRYSFAAEHDGELSISAGEDLIVLESSDPNWWLVQAPDGRRGLIPSSYLV